MEDFGRSEDFMVEELEIYVAGTIAVLAKNACDGGGYWRFVLIKQSDGNVVGGMRLCKRTRTETTGSCQTTEPCVRNGVGFSRKCPRC